jgi:hypothetical protein
MESPDLGEIYLLGSERQSWGSGEGGLAEDGEVVRVTRCVSDVVVLRRTQDRFVSWGHADIGRDMDERREDASACRPRAR